MTFTSHAHQSTTIWNSFDQGFDFGPLRAEDLFHIEWDFHVRTASARVFDRGRECLFIGHKRLLYSPIFQRSRTGSPSLYLVKAALSISNSNRIYRSAGI